MKHAKSRTEKVLLDLSPIGHLEKVLFPENNVLDKQFPVLKVAPYSYS